MIEKQILNSVFNHVRNGSFAVIYWDGTTRLYGGSDPLFKLIVRDPGIVHRLPDGIDLAFGEAYMDGLIDIEGDIADVVALSYMNIDTADTADRGWLTQALTKAMASARPHGVQKEDVSRHYDIGNAFFRLWLDESMTYSCGYFQSPNDSLEAAQRQKIDHSLRKVRLKPGERLLDIGSGWGALILRAIEQYGVNVEGITLSEEQYSATCDEIGRRGLHDVADVLLAHYETLAAEGSVFDKIVSIGMIEHVGKAHLGAFCDSVRAMLRPGGLALLHQITSPTEGPVNAWFDKYIFPGTYLPTVTRMIGLLAARGFRILDVENLRPHYQMTLDHWSDRFERSVEQVRAMFDERFVRMWRLYLRATSAGFRTGAIEIHQILVSNGVAPDLPLTRADLYTEPGMQTGSWGKQ